MSEGAAEEIRKKKGSGGMARILLIAMAVVSLVAIGYLSALIIHRHDQARELRDRPPLVLFSDNSISGLPAPPPLASSPKSVDDLMAIQELLVAGIDKSTPATVAISIIGRFHAGLAGSGVVVTEDGYVLTAGHVTANAGRKVTVTFPDGRTADGETLGMSMASDTGMIKITDSGKYPFVPLAEAGDLKIGDWCYALGYPGGYDQERGAVARIGRLIGTSLSTIRTDCKLLGGDSGGPLFNLRGELVGIHSRISDSPDENYHAPISAFHRGWQDLQEKQVINFWEGRNGGYLGIVESAPLEDDAGLLIREIASDSPAATAGLAVGDIITHIDGHKIIDRLEYSASVEGKYPGDSITIRFRRSRDVEEVNVSLGTKPQTAPLIQR